MKTSARNHYGGSHGTSGKTDKGHDGYDDAAGRPAFHEKPFYFKRARFLRFDYETDPDTATQLIPEQLTLTDPAVAFLFTNDYPNVLGASLCPDCGPADRATRSPL